jgi:uncharacterized protein (TIGR03000 family)
MKDISFLALLVLAGVLGLVLLDGDAWSQTVTPESVLRQMEQIDEEAYVQLTRIKTFGTAGSAPDIYSILAARHIVTVARFAPRTSEEVVRKNLVVFKDELAKAQAVMQSEANFRLIPNQVLEITRKWVNVVSAPLPPAAGKFLKWGQDIIEAALKTAEGYYAPQARQDAFQFTGKLQELARRDLESIARGLRQEYRKAGFPYKAVIRDFLTPAWGAAPDVTAYELATQNPDVRKFLEKQSGFPDLRPAAPRPRRPYRLSPKEQEQFRAMIAAEVQRRFKTFREKVRKEKEEKGRLETIQEAESAVQGLSALCRLVGQPELARGVSKVGEAVLGAYTSIQKFRLPTSSAGKIGAVALTGNLLGAVGTLLDLLGGPSLEQLILEEVRALRAEVQQLRREMHDRFDRIDVRLAMIHADLHDRLDRIERILDTERSERTTQLAEIQKSQAWLADRLAEFAWKQEKLFAELVWREARRTMDEILFPVLRNLEPTREDRARWFRILKESVELARGDLSIGAPVRVGSSASPQERLDRIFLSVGEEGFPAREPARRLRALLQVARLLGGVQADDEGPNPDQWQLLSNVVLRAANDWPKFTSEVEPSLLKPFVHGGRGLRRVFGTGPGQRADLLRVPAGKEPWGAFPLKEGRGETTFVARLLEQYVLAAVRIEAHLWHLQREWEKKRTKGVDLFATFQTIGSGDQKSAPVLVALPATRVPLPDNLAGTLFSRIPAIDLVNPNAEMRLQEAGKSLPKGVVLALSPEEARGFAERYLPPAALYAHHLEIGQLCIGYDMVGWGENRNVQVKQEGARLTFDNWGKLMIGLTVYLKVGDKFYPLTRPFVTSPREEKKGWHATSPTLQALLLDPKANRTPRVVGFHQYIHAADIYANRWTDELKGLLLKDSGRVQQRMSVAELKQSAESVEALVREKMRAERRQFEDHLLTQLKGDTEVRKLVRCVEGVKVLVESYLHMGFPRVLHDDDFRGQFHGVRPGLVDLEAILAELEGKRPVVVYGRAEVQVLSETTATTTTITVKLPVAGAALLVDNHEMTPAAEEVRKLVTPPLTPGLRYSYVVACRWQDEKRRARLATQKICFSPGQQVSIDFGPAARFRDEGNLEQPSDLYRRGVLEQRFQGFLVDLDRVARSGRPEQRPPFEFTLRRLEQLLLEVRAVRE